MRSKERVAVLVGITAFLLCATFAVSAIWIHQALEANSAEQALLRGAQINRARLFRLQLDEETGIRGYVATAKPIFLEPYLNARGRFDSVATRLIATLRALSMDDRVVLEQRTLNEQWLVQVARPSLQNPHSSELVVQLTGKSLVDGFRRLDALLLSRLTAQSASADAAASTLVTRLLVGALVLGVLLASVFGAIATAGFRLAARLDEQRNAYEEEKRIADALQKAFLGDDLPRVPTAVLDGVYVPAGLEAQVGGDWYDAFTLSADRILFSMGDVAGHGVEAAVVMSRARQSILAIGIGESDPGVILAHTNAVLCLQGATMVTALCGIIDVKEGTIAYACAGHPPIIQLLKRGDVRVLATGGPPLGLAGSTSYERFSLPILPGSMLVLYTDGLVEYSRDWEAGERALLEAIRNLDFRSPEPASALLKSVFHGTPPVDDVAILTIRFPDLTNKAIAVKAELAPEAVYAAAQ
ncbi:MAG: SpoIIE family protein phosphatase [Candidatus Cybelea sp.]